MWEVQDLPHLHIISKKIPPDLRSHGQQERAQNEPQAHGQHRVFQMHDVLEYLLHHMRIVEVHDEHGQQPLPTL